MGLRGEPDMIAILVVTRPDVFIKLDCAVLALPNHRTIASQST